jgi:nicotinate-nucleotide adenylyltransferase
VSRRGERLGIFGGTFDPVHLGHLIVATEIRHALALDRVLFLPAGEPPHKQGWTVSPAAHRVAMLRLALADDPGFGLCLHDVERPGLSYTADTLADLAARWPAAELFFLMGEDSLRDLPTWREPARIIAAARLAVVARPGIDTDLADLEPVLPGISQRVELTPAPEIGIAARDLRARVAAGRPIRYQVPAAVERYIREHGLYRDE